MWKIMGAQFKPGPDNMPPIEKPQLSSAQWESIRKVLTELTVTEYHRQTWEAVRKEHCIHSSSP